MAKDDKIVVFGEDVEISLFGDTRGLMAQFSDRFFASQICKYHPDLIFGQLAFARLAADGFDRSINGICMAFWYLSHSYRVMMSQISPLGNQPNMFHWH